MKLIKLLIILSLLAGCGENETGEHTKRLVSGAHLYCLGNIEYVDEGVFSQTFVKLLDKDNKPIQCDY